MFVSAPEFATLVRYELYSLDGKGATTSATVVQPSFSVNTRSDPVSEWP